MVVKENSDRKKKHSPVYEFLVNYLTPSVFTTPHNKAKKSSADALINCNFLGSIYYLSAFELPLNNIIVQICHVDLG